MSLLKPYTCQLRPAVASVRSGVSTACIRPRRRRSYAIRAVDPSSEEVYEGRFGQWRVTTADRLEVAGYRAGISVTALAFLLEGVFALLPADQQAARSSMQGLLDPVALAGAAGLGASLQLIHIYMAPLKRALQVFWAMGVAGMLYIMATQDVPAAVFVYENPNWVWAVGPLFAALTGVAFKEGLCYGKWEAAGLFGAIPLTIGGHLLQRYPHDVERGLLATCIILLSIFAGRKYTQAVKDDIGDKSIFEFQKLSPEQQRTLLSKLSGQD